MISQQSLEEAVLALLCFNDDLALKIAPRINPDKIFSGINRTNQKIAKHALEHIQKYATAPGMSLEYLLENDIQRSGEEGKLLGQQIQFLSKRVTEIDATFVMEQLDRFLEVQYLQTNLQRALEHLDAGELEDARKAAFEVDSEDKTDTPTINFSDPKSLSVLDKVDQTDYFSCGIQIFNKIGIRLGRKMLGFIIAAKGKGKSWLLIEVGKGGVQHHHKVLHITLEMSAEKTYMRYLQSFFALTKAETKQIKIPVFNRDEQGKFVSMDVRESIAKSIYQQREDIKRRLEMMYRSHLLIKEFPTGTLTTQNLYLYLEQLKRNEGFEADLLIIDYADLMRIDRSQLRIDTGRQYVEIRGLAVEKNCALWTATQGNRESENVKLVSNTNVAEDWSKIATADLVFTYTQTPQERLMNLARIFCVNFRDEDDKKVALISQSYTTGQFCIDSVLMNTDVSQAVSGATTS